MNDSQNAPGTNQEPMDTPRSPIPYGDVEPLRYTYPQVFADKRTCGHPFDRISFSIHGIHCRDCLTAFWRPPVMFRTPSMFLLYDFNTRLDDYPPKIHPSTSHPPRP